MSGFYIKDPGGTQFAGKTSFNSHVRQAEDQAVLVTRLGRLTQAIRKLTKEPSVPETQNNRWASPQKYVTILAGTRKHRKTDGAEVCRQTTRQQILLLL